MAPIAYRAAGDVVVTSGGSTTPSTRASLPGRVLVVTNDFPPRPGGIQSYLENLVTRLPSESVYVYAPSWRGCDEFDRAAKYLVHRHRTGLMIPTPVVAATMMRIIRLHRIDTVWFGAAAPLAVLAPFARRAGAQRVIASTHGHEVGWSMVPVARSVLRYIGNHTDVITYVSAYTRSRFSAAFGSRAAMEHLPPGVDANRFVPDADARIRIRARHDLGDAPVVMCLSRLVPRKGQDALIDALPEIARVIPDVRLLIVGGGPYRDDLVARVENIGVSGRVIFTGSVESADVAAYHAAADVFAMPSRTRGKGLDVEGLGIVYLEASACEIPVVAGQSGGAPETVIDGCTGLVVDGRDRTALAQAVTSILADPHRAASMGAAGRVSVLESWQWDTMARRLSELLWPYV